MGEWAQFKIEVPGIDVFEQVRALLETLLVFLEIAKTILETVKIFLIDFGNPIKALVEAIIKLILDFIESLNKTGLFLYADVPDFITDPECRRLYGGSQAFLTRWKGSLMDAKDLNRPQPIAGATTGGFVLLVADSDGISQLVAIIKVLLRFFNQDFLSPQYPPPANVRAVPVGSKQAPLLSVTSLFADPPTAIAVEWALPSSTNQSDNGFENLAQAVSIEFIPPKFLIERSSQPLSNEVSWDDISSATAAGYVTIEAETQVEIRGQPLKMKKRKIRLKDENNDPFIKFEQYTVIAADQNTASFLLGQLGTFRWIDTEVEKDKTYYYRVRAFSGTLQVDADKNLKLELGNRNEKETPADGANQYVKWPGPAGEDAPVMGRASGVVSCRIVDLPADFDVLENIRRVYLSAISYNFHLEAPADAKFDDNGAPAEGTPASAVGQGSLFSKTSLATYTSVPLVSYLFSNPNAISTPDPVTGEVPKMPWQQTNVRFQASRMSLKIASALLSAGSSAIGEFKSLMEGPFPKGAPAVAGDLDANNLTKLVFGLTDITYDESTLDEAQGAVTEVVLRTGTVDGTTAKAYVGGFTDVSTRANILVAVKYLNSFMSIGVPPNWTSVGLLRDLIPWSGQMLYELMEKIQAILDAFKGILDEIKAFIDLLIRKINVLEEFIQFLISILDFIESLSVGFYFLSATGLTGGVTDWFAAVDTATGEGPSSGPQGYTGGLCLAYNAVDVAAFTAAFSLIFG